MKNRKPGEPISLVGHSHGGNVAIEAANILVKEHGVQANEITIVALNTPRRSEINLDYDDVKLYSLSAKGDIIQEAGSDYSWPLLTNEVDISVIYDDKIDGTITSPDGNHIGPAKENVDEWLPKLEEELKKQQKKEEQTRKKIEARNKTDIEDMRKNNPTEIRLPENQ